MECKKYTDLIPLVAMGDATDAEKAAFEQHAEHCESCRAELERMREIVAMFKGDPTEAPGEIETLRMQNEILRRLAEESFRSSALRHSRAPLRMLIRVAAAIVLFAVGYLVRPGIARLIEPSPPTARLSGAIATRDQIQQAMKSGYRFSGAGLAVIAHGADALKQVARSDTLP